MSLQRKKTECVGSLVLPAEMMSAEAGTPTSTQKVVTSAVEHFGDDIKRSVNLQKRKTEAYGTLIVDAMDQAAPNSPSVPSPERSGKVINNPMDENPQEIEDFLFGL